MAFNIPGGDALGGVAGALGGPQLSYAGLQEKYYGFSNPRASVVLGGRALDSAGKGMVVDEVHVELTSGYEASMASFRIYDVFDPSSGQFFFSRLKKEALLGNSVELSLGYLDRLERVFVGFVSGVAFGFESQDLPYIEITALDVKGVMMGGSYAAALTAATYSAAVKEVLQRTGEGRLQQMGGITEPPDVSSTPDADLPDLTAKSSPITVEMVGESDYEFVVRAAKRFNFEFFVDRGKVIFRPAKSDASVLMKLSNGAGLRSFRMEYSLNSVVGKIEARAMDPGAGKVISSSSSFNNTLSTAGKAKQLMGKGAKVYVDASIQSREDAEARVKSLMEKMSYRLGSLESDSVGIPDLLPGRFVEVEGFGTPVDNRFYLTAVTHDFSSDGGFVTQLRGCADQVRTGLDGLI